MKEKNLRIPHTLTKLTLSSSRNRALPAIIMGFMILVASSAIFPLTYATKPIVTLTSPNPVGAGGDLDTPYPGGMFGYNVATGGGYIFVCAPWENGGTVYAFSAATKAYVTTMGSAGSVVTTGGGFVAIGNPGAGVGGTVYVYSLSDLNTIVATIADPYNPDEWMTYQAFGESIAISGSQMLISDAGASVSDTGISGNPGAGWTGDVYVYSVPGFNFITRLSDPNPIYSIMYAPALAFCGNYIVVGAPAAKVGGSPSSGTVYVYDSVYNLVSTIGNPSTDGFDFGLSVTSGSGYFVVGAPGNAVTSSTGTVIGAAGTAYIYSLNAQTGATSLTATLNSKNPTEGGYFGYSVSTDGTNVIVGAPGESVTVIVKDISTALNPAGNAYVFTSSGSYSKTLSSPNPEGYTWNTQFGDDYGGYFGLSVAAGNGFYVVGAPGENVVIGTHKSSTTYVDAGHAYILVTDT